ncbi:2-oxoglutarate dehydrogenase complex dihydrolipoyllysine-residue succinyltransferase [Hymenobacter sp. HDW8]|uniref:2-oxoglutarate dehydrogenase complex dihydrolipoyllysine-residue succinyltransferase n=1 Tax=Hymenobacter sp. HDW8 TaxID=2714932 RepID=UPI00140D447D|nr:2-oxoglutarate dehydrogenase complex dihydrolipoyllysine-residue succinyltransferase [Hymenobacter sp. HDW8]QIL76193.1 2-oxoglutarate dehydrogenase complex dihydrolipoyllysine-residue succinyltransferase [Hymenobacter sp. HDW8]
MGLEIKIPAVGESITEVTIAKWLKSDGAAVKRDEVIAELESDKATFELPAEADGTLQILVAEGETIGIGTVIANIGGEGNGAAPAAGSATPSKEATLAQPQADPVAPGQKESGNNGSQGSAAEKGPQTAKDPITQGEQNPQASDQSGYGGSTAGSADKPTAPAAGGAAPATGGGEVKEMKIPAVGESITEVTVAKWLKADGAQVERDEVIAELESDKATFELPAEAAGTLRHAAQEGQTIAIGTVIARIEGGSGATAGAAPAASAPAAAQSTSSAPAQPAAAAASGSATYATGTPSPAAGKILGEKGIAATDVQGTGRDGRITKEDAQNAQARPAAPAPQAPAATPATSTQPAASASAQPAGERNQRRERMSNLRKTVARRLVAVKNETAMLTTFNEVDMQPIMDLRTKYKDKFKEKHQVGLGFMSFFTKACCVALKEFPSVNAQIDGTDIVFNDFCDVSIAVSAPKGLVVPVIRNAEQLSFEGIEREVVRLAGKARDNKLTIEEMTGGTFTITNGGIFGSMMSTPIINAPQSAILGMHNIVQRPVAVNGQVVIRPMMYLALSYDHRIIDGRESVSFLVRVKELLEDPTRLLLGV